MMMKVSILYFKRTLSIREGFIPSFFYIIRFKPCDLFIVLYNLKGDLKMRTVKERANDSKGSKSYYSGLHR